MKLCVTVVFALGVFPGAAAEAASAGAEPVAHWRFDEPVGSLPGTILRDAGPAALSLVLGPGGRIVPGRSGGALRPTSSASMGSGGTAFAARRARPGEDGPPGPSLSVTDSKLNLGAGDWTLEGWLRLDAGADAEGIVLEIGTAAGAADNLVTRFSVLPRENAFAFTGLAPVGEEPASLSARRVEFPDPGGPPAGSALVFTATLALDGVLPRERWFHAALVHSNGGTLRLFLDGRPGAVAHAELLPLPRSAQAYLAIGRDGRAQQPFPGAIDELRVSDRAVYAGRFAAPNAGRHDLPP